MFWISFFHLYPDGFTSIEKCYGVLFGHSEQEGKDIYAAISVSLYDMVYINVSLQHYLYLYI